MGVLGILQAGGAYVPLRSGLSGGTASIHAFPVVMWAAIVLDARKAAGQAERLWIPAETRLVALDGQWGEIAKHAWLS